MRILPRSLTGRILGVMFIGLVLIVVDISFALSYLYSDRQEKNVHSTIKIGSFIELYNASPVDNRRNLFLGQDDIRLLDEKPELTPYEDLHLNWIKYHFTDKLTTLGIKEVLVGNATDDQLYAVVQTQDEKWIAFSINHHPNWGVNIMAMISVLSILFIGLFIIALIISRHITRPMKRFAYAANLFGTDIDAPPIEDECGPKEVSDAAQAFNRMQERIRRFVQERTQMLGAISHDLRTPLTRLRLRAEYIEDEEQQQKAVADIEEMQAMIETSLNFARQHNDQEATAAVDINELLHGIVEQYADMNKNVEFNGNEKILMSLRPLAMKRCLSNILNNALQFGERAQVEIEAEEDKVSILIKDDGPGIPVEERQKVFSPFYRLEPSRNRNTGGAGLGLAVAQGVVHGHGGTIEILDNQPKGTIVKIVLPLTQGTQ